MPDCSLRVFAADCRPARPSGIYSTVYASDRIKYTARIPAQPATQSSVSVLGCAACRLFVTRQRGEGIRPKSGWVGQAGREWNRRAEVYRRYHGVIAPLLPPAVRRFYGQDLHDAVAESASRTEGVLRLAMDATHALDGYGGPRIGRAFSGIRGRFALRGLRRPIRKAR
jgi:hypothetical protein